LKKQLYDDKLALVIFDEEQKFGVTHKNWFQEHFPWVKVISVVPHPYLERFSWHVAVCKAYTNARAALW